MKKQSIKKDSSRPTEVDGDNIVAEFGDSNRNIAVGKDIRQIQATPEDIALVQDAFVRLRRQVETESPPDKRDHALEHIAELEEAVTSGAPDHSTIRYISGWFGKNIPQMASTVAGLLTDPNIQKLIGTSPGDGGLG